MQGEPKEKFHEVRDFSLADWDRVGERARELRERFNLASNREFAARAGVDPKTIGTLMHGDKIAEGTLYLLASKFGVRPEWLIWGDGEMFPRGGASPPMRDGAPGLITHGWQGEDAIGNNGLMMSEEDVPYVVVARDVELAIEVATEQAYRLLHNAEAAAGLAALAKALGQDELAVLQAQVRRAVIEQLKGKGTCGN